MADFIVSEHSCLLIVDMFIVNRASVILTLFPFTFDGKYEDACVQSAAVWVHVCTWNKLNWWQTNDEQNNAFLSDKQNKRFFLESTQKGSM